MGLNKKRKSDYNKQYRKDNEVYLKEYDKQYYIENKEKIKLLSQSPEKRFLIAKRKAKQRNQIFDLSFEQWIEKIKDKKCYYCSRELNLTGIGLDRKNGNNGYLVENVVPCCKRCNETFMNNYSFEEKLILAKSIREIDSLRKTKK